MTYIHYIQAKDIKLIMGCWPEWFRILIDNNTIEHAITVGLLNVFSATDGLMKKRFLAVWNVYLFSTSTY